MYFVDVEFENSKIDNILLKLILTYPVRSLLNTSK